LTDYEAAQSTCDQIKQLLDEIQNPFNAYETLGSLKDRMKEWESIYRRRAVEAAKSKFNCAKDGRKYKVVTIEKVEVDLEHERRKLK
jgi:hypothetical protein